MVVVARPPLRLGTVLVTDRTRDLLARVLEDGQVGQGLLIHLFEDELAAWLGVRHVVAVANGTAADTVALAAVKEMGEGRDEVILPALTFIAQVNAVYYNHLRPVFVDVGDDFQIDASEVEERIGPRTLAIMPVHLLGRPAPMDALVEVARGHRLWIVEDACEALGSQYRGRWVGTLGDAGCFSFFVSHSITTGEGGAIATNNGEVVRLARSLLNHGRLSDRPLEKFRFPRIGFSAKMNQLEAAVGLGVMPALDGVLERRRRNLLLLNEMLGPHFPERPGEHIVPHAYPILLDNADQRDRALLLLHARGVEARTFFSSIPTQEEAYAFLGHRRGEFPRAEAIGECGFYIPCHQDLTEEDIAYLAEQVQEVLESL